MEMESVPCYEVWARKGTTDFGIHLTATTALTFASVHRAQGLRAQPAAATMSSDTKAGLAKGDSWTPFGGTWQVAPGESCELRVVLVPKGGKARLTITVGGATFPFDCTSGHEAVTAKFRLSVY